MTYYTYITTNSTKNVLYVGITNNLKRRIGEHTADRGKWATFAGRYYCHRLIYYETYNRVIDAIRREKEIKDRSRMQKFNLIKEKNPELAFYRVL